MLLSKGELRSLVFLHFGASNYDPEKIRPILNIGFKCVGPLFATPLDSTFRWDDEYRGKDLSTYFRFRLIPEANILKLSDEKDLKDLPIRQSGLDDIKIVDFEKLNYDGIYITLPLAAGIISESGVCFFGWDCETLAVFNPHVVKEIK